MALKADVADACSSNATQAWPLNLCDFITTTSRILPNCEKMAYRHFFISACNWNSHTQIHPESFWSLSKRHYRSYSQASQDLTLLIRELQIRVHSAKKACRWDLIRNFVPGHKGNRIHYDAQCCIKHLSLKQVVLYHSGECWTRDVFFR